MSKAKTKLPKTLGTTRPRPRSILDELEPEFTKRSTQGRKSRAKGSAYERTVANYLKRIYPDARRLFGQSRDGHEVPDVGGTPFWIEASDAKSVSAFGKVAQALFASQTSKTKEYANCRVIAFVKKGKQEIVAMDKAQFLSLLAHLATVMENFS